MQVEEFFTGDIEKCSKWLDKFKLLSEEKLLELKGDQIFVEKLPPVLKQTKSGIIIATTDTHKKTICDSATEFGVVLMVGPGQYFEDGTIQPCDAKVGDVILLPGNVFWYGAFFGIPSYQPDTIGRLRDSQVPVWTRNYKQVYEVLNG